MNQQPSEWAQGILRVRQEIERKESIKAELRLRDERMLESKAPELWQAILVNLKADCEALRCHMSDIPLGQMMGQPAVRIESTARPTTRIVTARFDLNGRLIKVARSHVSNVVEVSDGSEIINLQLENDQVVCLLDDLKLRTAKQVSNYIMASIVESDD